MRLLHVLASAAPEMGGPTTAAIQMSGALAAAGHDVTVVSHDDGSTRSSPEFSPSVSYQAFPLDCGIAGSRWQFSRQMKNFLRQNVAHFDAVHVHGIFLAHSFYGAKYALASDVPLVIRPAGSLNRADLKRNSTFRKAGYLRLVEARGLNRASSIHCTSEDEHSQVRDRGFDNAVVVPHGVDELLWQLERIPPERTTFLYLGRVTEKKGLDLVLDAMAMEPSLCDARLVVAGSRDSAYARRCLDLAADAGIDGRITWLGHVGRQQALQLLAGSTALVLPSEDENFGIAVAEALAAGLPVLTTARVSMAERIRSHAAGWIVERTPAAVAAGMVEAKLGSGERALNARTAAAPFRWSEIVTSLEGLYA